MLTKLWSWQQRKIVLWYWIIELTCQSVKTGWCWIKSKSPHAQTTNKIFLSLTPQPVLNMTFSSVDMDESTWPYAASNTSIADLSFSLNVSAAGTVFRKITYKTGFLTLLYKVCIHLHRIDVTFCSPEAVSKLGEGDCLLWSLYKLAMLKLPLPGVL